MSFDLKLSNGDLVIKNGDLDIVTDTDKLIQDVLKIISTQLGGNPFFPSYGSPITGALIGTAYDQNFMTDVATQQLQRTLEKMQQLQNDQIRRNQRVSAAEQLAAIRNVSITRDYNDPRNFRVALTVLNKSFQSVPIAFSVTGA